MSKEHGNEVAPNAYRLLWAGFVAILAAGVGFAIRGGVMDNWGREFGFTSSQLGVIAGHGLTGFCFGIIIGGMVADKIGYGWLVITAFLLHVVSGVVTIMPRAGTSPDSAYQYLFWGTFLFAIANGTLEAVANPLVATLFPKNRTHFLNILHASWPLGLVLGGICGWVLDDRLQMDWRVQIALYLIPTVVYGLMFLGQRMPRSEASEKGLSLGEMFKDVGLLGGLVICYFISLFFGSLLQPLDVFQGSSMPKYIGYGAGGALLLAIGVMTNFSLGSWLLFVLFVLHAMIGAVELGTDQWIQNITGNILTSEQGKILFVFTSMVMFLLRFCADFIEKKLGLSPIWLLFVCAVLAFVGLNLTSMVNTFGAALLALTVYGVGKTFFWPTMLAVASDRFPRTGAVAISIMGGIGMMSAGLIGTPSLGYLKDRYAGQALQSSSPALFEQYKAEKTSEFLFFDPVVGLDNQKLGQITDDLTTMRKTQAEAGPSDLPPDQATVLEASITGDRRTLVTDSFIPATMALIYLCLGVYFRAIGGYRVVHIDEVQEKKRA